MTINKKMAVRKEFTRQVGNITLTLTLVAGPVANAYAGQSFQFLESGFTQEIYGVNNSFFGGVAFAPDGDPWVNNCFASGGSLTRFDDQTLLPSVNGTATLHDQSTVASDAGCGMANNRDGFIYSNTNNGISQINASTGAATGFVFGVPGNTLGIASDPIGNNVFHIGRDGTVYTTPVNGASTELSTVTKRNFIDGLYFDPSGQYLFLANRTLLAATILKRDGTLVQNVPLSAEPDGFAFHLSPSFVVANNTDGTMTKLTFPGNDFTQAPNVSIFASGGFRGDLSQVGNDGCIYLTQNGTRYDDGTETSENSLVKICAGFAPQFSISKPNPCTGVPPTNAIIGTKGDDYIMGTANNDVIFSFEGNDKIEGLAGNDLICAGSGNDIVKGGDGNDTIQGGEGNDTLKGGAGNDKIGGGKGDDFVDGGWNKDTILGGDGNDVLISLDYTKANDTIDGGTDTSGDSCIGDRGDILANCEPKSCDDDEDDEKEDHDGNGWHREAKSSRHWGYGYDHYDHNESCESDHDEEHAYHHDDNRPQRFNKR